MSTNSSLSQWYSAALALAFAGPFAGPTLAQSPIARASVATSGAQANDYSGADVPALSADGRFVLFGSLATDLADGDTNDVADIFVADRTLTEADASWSSYGAGHPGTLGVPALVASDDPVLEATISIDLENSSGQLTAGLLLVGLEEASIPTSAGGTLLVLPLVILEIEIPSAGKPIPATIPSDPSLCGLSSFLQALEADSGASHSNSFTPGLRLTFGR